MFILCMIVTCNCFCVQIAECMSNASDVVSTAVLEFLSLLLYYGNNNVQKALGNILLLKPDMVLRIHDFLMDASSALQSER